MALTVTVSKVQIFCYFEYQ